MQSNFTLSRKQGGFANGLSLASLLELLNKSRKIAFVFILIFGANVAFAEESGGFIGVGVGYGWNKYEEKYYEMWQNVPDNVLVKRGANNVDYGFVLGYKHFFTPYLGLRYYGSVNLNHSKIKEGKINLINYNGNIDFLGNFVATRMVDFGAFIGFGVGGNSWSGDAIKTIKYELGLMNDYFEISNTKINQTSLDISINLGLRINIAKYHGLEIVKRFSMLKTDLFKTNGTRADEFMQDNATIVHKYSIMARYVVSF